MAFPRPRRRLSPGHAIASAFDRIPVRLRLSLGHAMWMGIMFLAIGFGLYGLIEHRFFQSVDASLRTAALTYRSSLQFDRRRDPALDSMLQQFLFEDFTRSIKPFGQIINLSGKVSARSPNVFNANLPVTPSAVKRAELGLDTFENFFYKGVIIRQVTLPVLQRGKFTGELIQVAASLGPILDTLRGVQKVLWIVLPSALGLSIVFGYFLTARSLKPVRTISKTASKLGSDDLSLRLPLPAAHDELRDLVSTFNDMLDRLEDAFNRLRRFTGDVSHELRTPLSVLRGEAELALRREREPDYYQNSLRTVVKEAENMTGIIDDLLLLAKAHSKSVAMHWQPIPAESFISGLVQSTRAQCQAKDIELIVENRISDHFYGSANYLALAIKNLLSNAVKHSYASGQVVLKAWTSKDAIHFGVTDSGEGIPESSLPYVFDTFYRADTARNRAMGGTGLGLSLAMALIKLHHGRIHVESKEGNGAYFEVVIPQNLSVISKSGQEALNSSIEQKIYLHQNGRGTILPS